MKLRHCAVTPRLKSLCFC